MNETIIGEKYKLIRLLGEGGMGKVYEAENTWTERRVALKIIHHVQFDDKKAVERFLQEGRLAARVSHPNIVEILDMGQDTAHGILYMVQEFLTGISLRHLLTRKEKLDVNTALDLLIPIMGALVAAHDRGIVHRDVKPDNVILTKMLPDQLSPKLIDFGISTLVVSSDDKQLPSNPNVIIGTPAYMAPEQLMGKSHVDHRADVWAVGAVMYETLTGRTPFIAESLLVIMDKICNDDPTPIRELAPNVPADLAQVIHKALTRDREHRHAGMQDLLEETLKCPSLISDSLETSLLWRHRNSIPYDREHERYDVNWQVTLKCPAWESAQELLTANISRGGVFVVSEEVLEIGDSLEVMVEFPNDLKQIFLGTVQHVVTKEESTEGKQPGMGIKFDKQHEVDLILLEQMASTYLDSSFQAIQFPKSATEYFHTPATEAEDGSLKEAPTDPFAHTVQNPIGAIAVEHGQDQKVSQQETLEVPTPVPAPPSPAAAPPAPAPQEPGPPPAPRSRTEPHHVPLPRGKIADAVGIDFGTTFCSVSVAVGERVYLIADENEQRLFPSIVCYPERGVPMVGWNARRWLLQEPSRTFTSIKRVLGRKVSDPSMAGYVNSLPYKIVEGPDGLVLFELDGDPIAPIQIAATIFEHLVRIANRQIGKTFTKAVVSVPIGFRDNHRSAVKRAAQIAGIEVLELLDEPVAGALAYGYGQQKEELIAVYDFGGGTFDFSVLQMRGNQYKVLGSADAPWLGGDDFDTAIAQDTADAFWRQTEIDLSKRKVEWQRLLFACERAKRVLSTRKTADIQVPGILERPKMVTLQQPIDQAKLEMLCRNAFQITIDLCNEGLARAGVTPQSIDQVVLTGGISRIPFIQRGMSRLFQREVLPVISPDEAVCLGTGIQAAIKVKHAITGAARL